MNLKSIKYQTQIQKWTQIVQKRNQSGLRILDFCAQEGITKDAYYYWLRRVREAALESQTGIDVVDTKPRLVNITPALPAEEPSPIQCDGISLPVVSSDANTFSTQLTITVGKAIVGVNQNTPKELLSSVMEVLARA